MAEVRAIATKQSQLDTHLTELTVSNKTEINELLSTLEKHTGQIQNLENKLKNVVIQDEEGLLEELQDRQWRSNNLVIIDLPENNSQK
jgi:hypothetical protein